MDLTFIALLVGIIISETSAQYFLQQRVNSDNNLYLVLGIIFYALVAGLYYGILQRGQKLAIANSLWNAGTEITVALLGLFIFKQSLSIKQLIGIVFTILGINLLR